MTGGLFKRNAGWRRWAGGAGIAILACVAGGGTAQEQAPDLSGPGFAVQFINSDLSNILGEYEFQSGRRIVRDAAIQGATLTVHTNGPLPTKAESLDFIEKSLLLNGFALVPTADKNTMKLIAYAAGKNPRSEGVPVFTKPEDLPPGDDLVTFIMPLEHLAADQAAETFIQVMPPHPYGNITALANARALVVTENASAIRTLLEVRAQIDLPPSEMVDRAFQLERGDAEDIAEALAEILGLDAKDDAQPTGRPSATLPSPVGGQPTVGNAESSAIGNGSPGKTYGSPTAVAGRPIIRAIVRTNRILAVARPVDMEYIARLIAHLDSPQEISETHTLKLNHLKPTHFLDIASDALTRGLDGAEGSRSGTGQLTRSNQLADGSATGFGSGGSRFSGDGARDGLGSSSGFGSGGGGVRRGGGGGGGGSGMSSQLPMAPISMVVGKTLLIADDLNSTLMVSGPSEQVELIEKMLQTLDVKPRQIQISAIIAQISLGDRFEFGFDLIRTLETVGPDGRIYNAAGLLKNRIGNNQAIFDTNKLDQVKEFPNSHGLSFYGQVNPYLDLFLSALAATNRFEVLSRPTIYTLNNEYASILNGQRVAVPRSTQSTVDPTGGTNQVVTASIDYIDVVLQIDVLPSINVENQITLKIRQVNDSIVGSQTIGGDDIPTIGTQELETTVMVPNGGTVLLGGLISDSTDRSESSVPWVRNVPVVGDIIGGRTQKKDRRELLVFIQPKIIDDEIDRQHIDADLKNRTEVALVAEPFAENLPGAKVMPAAKNGLLKRMWERVKWGSTPVSRE